VGQVYLAEKPMSLEQLAEQLDTVDRDAHLLLRVDEATPFGHFVAVVDLMKARGMENLSIITRSGAG
jgi:biopolymer transport protein ExbD